MIEEALELADRGFRVHPIFPMVDGRCACNNCNSHGKHPRKQDWPKAATDNKSIVTLWWQRNPNDGIGIATGRGVVVVDLDGQEGIDYWDDNYGFKTNLVARTGGGGRHLFFTSNEPIHNSVRKLGTGIDIRAEGGYVVGAPSLHKSGNRYEWIENGSPSPLPRPVLDKLNEQDAATWKPSAYANSDNTLAVWPFGIVREGEGRNHRLASFVGKCLREGVSPEETYGLARSISNQYCVPPLPEAELVTIIRSIVGREERRSRAEGRPEPWNQQPVTLGVTGSFKLVKASSLQYMPVDWIWRQRLAAGKITILDGNPGTGKSGLTMDVAARLSTGAHWPDGQPAYPASDVIVINGEDDPGDTIMPRLVAAGADCERVHVVTGEQNRLPQLPDSLGDIEGLIKSVQAKLLIIDPLMAYLSGTINSNSDQEVRRALAPLAAMASRTGCAVLVVRHLNKRSDVGALARGGGSMGIIGQARLGFMLTSDKNIKGRSILTPTKSNISALADSRAYRKKSNEQGILVIEWEPDAVDLDADAALQGVDPEVHAATQYLERELADEAKPLEKLEKDAKAMGISSLALAQAKIGMCVRITTNMSGVRYIDLASRPEPDTEWS